LTNTTTWDDLSDLLFHELNEWGQYGDSPMRAYQRWFKDTIELVGSTGGEGSGWEHLTEERLAELICWMESTTDSPRDAVNHRACCVADERE